MDSSTIILYESDYFIQEAKPCINCTIVVLHYQFLVVRLLQSLSGLPEMELNC